ncbi:unnamed protein product [Urochloa humidicola]
MCSGWHQVSPHGHGGAVHREAGTAVRADATRAAACSQRRREVDAGGVQGGVWCVWPCEAAKGGAARAGWGGTASSLLQEGWPRGGCCGRARGGPAARWIGGGCGDMVEPKTRTRVGASPAASTPVSAPPPGSHILPPPSRPPQPPSSFFVVSVFLTGKTAQAAMPFATSSLSHLPATRTHQIQYPFFTEGTQDLLNARVDIVQYSVLESERKSSKFLKAVPWKRLSQPCEGYYLSEASVH